jgi:RNA methyltransferase, TrmH family
MSNPPLGRHHPQIKRIRALYRDPALRRAEGVFLAEGLHLAEEALEADPQRIALALVSSRLGRREEGQRLRHSLASSGVLTLETGDDTLEALQDASSAQPVLLVMRRPDWPADAGLLGPLAPLVVVLHGVQDPGNVGGILRTADAAGATAAFVCGEAADPFHPRAVRASMGAIFRLPFHAATTSDVLDLLRGRTIRAMPIDAAGTRDYSTCDFRSPVALFFGREGSGLPTGLLNDLAESVRVSMRPGVESLSVGAAAAVILFEAARQRRSESA